MHFPVYSNIAIPLLDARRMHARHLECNTWDLTLERKTLVSSYKNKCWESYSFFPFPFLLKILTNRGWGRNHSNQHGIWFNIIIWLDIYLLICWFLEVQILFLFVKNVLLHGLFIIYNYKIPTVFFVLAYIRNSNSSLCYLCNAGSHLLLMQNNLSSHKFLSHWKRSWLNV